MSSAISRREDSASTRQKKARAALYQLKRAVSCRDPEVFLPLYKTSVRPHLEYCVQAWNPYLKKDIHLVERVQRSATKIVKGLKGLSYPSRLKRLNLFSRPRRRVRGDLIEAFKLQTKVTDVSSDIFFTHRNAPYLRGHAMILHKPRVYTNTRSQFFSQRVIDAWNKLPSQVIKSNSVAAFKNKIDQILDVVFPDLI